MSEWTKTNADVLNKMIALGGLRSEERDCLIAARGALHDQAAELKARGEILDMLQEKAGTTSWIDVGRTICDEQQEIAMLMNEKMSLMDEAHLNAKLQGDILEKLAQKEDKLAKAEACLRDIAWRCRYKTHDGYEWTDGDFLEAIAKYFEIDFCEMMQRMDAAAKGW